MRGRDQIDITFPDHLAAIRQPVKRPVNGLIIASDSANEWCLRNALVVSGGLQQIIRQTGFEVPLLALRLGLADRIVNKRHPQAGTQDRFGAQHMFESGNGNLYRIKVLLIRQECHSRSGISLADFASDLQLRSFLSAFELH